MPAELTQEDLAGAYLSQPYDVKLGVDGAHWFVGVKPPITDEMMATLGGSVMQGWAVEEIESTTVFRKQADASKEASRDAAEQLVEGLMLAGAECVRLDRSIADMKGLSTPFESPPAA